MALTDAKIRAAKPDDKPYKLADSGNMFLLVHPKRSVTPQFGARLDTEGLSTPPPGRPCRH
ncbi:Uncharacterised protein [Serratia proteamaculans]|jgi:hypothetical protein|nr:Uncharacterised protein [Serratia proteamaculans]